MNLKRISKKNGINNKHGTYIMTSSLRVLDNHALYYLIKNYESYNIVIFKEPLHNTRHDDYFELIASDLINTISNFAEISYKKNIANAYKLVKGDVILDKGYLNEEKIIEQKFALHAVSKGFGYTVIESNVTVPVYIVSNKEEYSARTIRNKISRYIYDFLDPVNDSCKISKTEKEALDHCEDFIKNKLPLYHLKNHPEFNYTSSLSVYLKYGIISPIRIYILLENTNNKNKESFIEEFIIRRELAYNFVYYNTNYSNFNNITYQWAYISMENHKHDIREYLYTKEDYITFNTHDPYFNAAMKEMVYFGSMHGYMRMYWCKKIIEWSPTYKYAYDTAIFLNNFYFLDGNTPNGYTGVAWCFGKHDRAWKEREIFGKIRYMNASGLRRKFDIAEYVNKINKKVNDYVEL